MARGFRLDVNSRSGMLVEPAMRLAIHAVAQQVATRAAAMAGGDQIEVHMGGRSRARAYVVRLGSGLLGEAVDRALLRALIGGGF